MIAVLPNSSCTSKLLWSERRSFNIVVAAGINSLSCPCKGSINNELVAVTVVACSAIFKSISDSETRAPATNARV